MLLIESYTTLLATKQKRVVTASGHHQEDKGNVTLLQVVSVRVFGRTGTRDTLALLDPGAQTSLCSQKLADKLGISGEPQELCMQTIQGTGRGQVARKLVMEVQGLSPEASEKRITLSEVWAVPKMNISVPRISERHRQTWRHLENLDVPDCSKGEVQLLLGANVLEAVIQHEVRAGPPGQPVAIRTDFGWALTGAVPALVPESTQSISGSSSTGEARPKVSATGSGSTGGGACPRPRVSATGSSSSSSSSNAGGTCPRPSHATDGGASRACSPEIQRSSPTPTHRQLRVRSPA